MIKKVLSAVLYLFLLTSYSFGATISGTIQDSSSNPIPGASIVIDGLNHGTISDGDGLFSIELARKGEFQIKISHVAYKSVLVEINIEELDEELDLGFIGLKPTALKSDEVIFSINRVQTELRHNPRTLNLVTSENLQKMMPRSSAEALRETGGIHIQKTSHGGGSATLRGLNANRILLLVDGIRLNNSTFRSGNHPYLTTVDYAMLKRIEVVHGPTSVQYGSDALGGAINLISNLNLLSELNDVKVSLDNRYASADQQYVSSSSFAVNRGNWGLNGGLSYKSFGDLIPGKNGLAERLAQDINDDAQTPTAFQSRDLNLNFIYRNKFNHTLQLAWQHNERPQVPRYDKYAYNDYEHWYYKPQSRDLAYLKYSGKDGKYLKFYDIILSLQRFEEGRSIRKNSSSSHIFENDKVYTPGLIFQSQFWMKNHHFTWGSDFYFDFVSSSRESISPDNIKTVYNRGRYPDDANYLSSGFFVFDEIFISPAWRITPGIRFSYFQAKFDLDDSEYLPGDFSQDWSALTGSISSIYHLSNTFSLKTNFGQAFRAPNLSDMAKLGESKGELYEIPNSSLEPEKLIGFDLGPSFDNGRFSGSIVYYYSIIDDIILSAPVTLNGSSTITIEGNEYELRSRQNLGETYINGFTTSLEIDDILSGLNFRSNLNWTYGTNTSTDKAADAIPPLSGFVALDYRFNKFYSEFNCRFAAAKKRLSPDDFDDARIPELGNPGWYTLNYRFDYEFSENLIFRGGIENIIDKGYREYGSGINATGRNWLVGILIKN